MASRPIVVADERLAPHFTSADWVMPITAKQGSLAALGDALRVRAAKTDVALLVSATNVAKWCIRFKRLGIFGRKKIVFYSHHTYRLRGGRRLVDNISERDAQHLDRVALYYRNIITTFPEPLKERAAWVCWPGFSTSLVDMGDVKPAGYVFAGGYGARDFRSLIEAAKTVGVPLRIETLGRRDTINKRVGNVEIPADCTINFRDRRRDSLSDYLRLMKAAKIVVVPVRRTRHPKGLTDTLQAMRLGKAVVTTTSHGLDDYIEDRVTALRYPAGDVEALAAVIDELNKDPVLRKKLERNALEASRSFTPEKFREALLTLCDEVSVGAESV